MNYELRKLKSDDLFSVTSIINKIGFKEFKSCFTSPEVMKMMNQANDENTTVNVESIGNTVAFDALGIIIENMSKVKDDLYTFLGSLSGLTKKEISDLPLPDFAQMIIDVFQKEEFNDFFQVVAKFLK